jgi:Effector Associated Constant Component 1
MDHDDVKVRVELGLEPDSDAGELDEATLQLRRELLELDVLDVKRPSEGPAPPGTRAVDATVLGTLVVTATQGVVGAVIQAVMGWLARRPNRSITVGIAGDSIEVTDPSAEDQRRLIEAFLARHAAN